MRVSYARDGGIGCIMRSILVDDFGNNSCITQVGWNFPHNKNHTEYYVSEETMKHLYREWRDEDDF